MTHPTSPKLEASLDWRVVAGIATPDVPNWKRVRVAQLAELARLLPLTFLAFIVSAGTVTWLFARSVPAWQLGGWLGSVVVVMGSAVHMVRRARPTAFGEPHIAAMLRGGWRGLALGMLWMLPALLFASGGSLEQQLAICLVCAAMMAVATITTAAVPGILIAYLAPVAVGLSLMLSRTGSPVLTVLPIVYAAMLAAGGIVSGRALIARQWAEYALEEKSEVVRLLLREFEDAGADWLWQVDGAKRLVGVSPRLARAAGRSPADLEGMPLLDLLAGNLGSSVNSRPLRLLVETMNARESFADLQFEVGIGDETRWWSLSASPRNDGNGDFDGFRGVGSDITEHRRSVEKIDRMARFDALTGLPNRREFMESLRHAVGHALSEHQPCALLLIDLDKFKPVNDTLGHPIGDRLLKLVAERLRGAAGANDVCGRLGGDEFAIVLGRVEPGAVERLGGDIIAAIGAPFEIDGHIIRIGASVGSAMAPRDGRSVETLIRNADLALYRAKDEGRGTLRRYDPSMLVQAERRRAIEAALREAIDKGDQFRLMYQPVVDADQGVIQSFEALIRWEHPTLGPVSPADFLPIAEEARLAGRIGEWVLRTACAEAARWPDTIRVSVNLAMEQLNDRQLPATILSALSHAGLEPHRLELEVSETALIRENETMIAVLDGVQALGVRIALDDFGVGYTAFGHIRFGRFSAIKIDNTFVRGAARGSKESLAIVAAGVAIADALGVATVAEGAETHADLASMRKLGLQRIQGHLAGAPMLAEAARALVSTVPPGPMEQRSVA